MEHDGSFDDWWNSQAICENRSCTQAEFYSMFNITEEDFTEFKFKNGFNKGDVMVLTSFDKEEIGDTIVYFSSDGRPIIHRMISLEPLETKGDHNKAQIMTQDLNEKNVAQYEPIGKASLRIPLIGYVKIAFVETLSLFGISVR